tara:strand:+ start:50 stop:901 length:852 start_codon:yes stop_codon:yes gene_type:complete
MKVKNLLDEPQNVQNSVPVAGKTQRLEVQFIQPWSNIIAKVKMPENIFKEFSSLYDTVMKDEELINFGDKLVGQVNSEPFVKGEKLDEHKEFRDFCIDAVRNFVVVQKRQNYGHDPIKLAEFESDKLNIKLTSMWFVNQKPGEYNPVHVHTGCKVSAIAYLRTPKYQVAPRKKHFNTDGMVSFTNNSGNDFNWTNPTCHLEPREGDFYIFGALQQHMVWPYRSTKEDDLRISMSFNADVISQSELEKQKQQYEEMQKQRQNVEQQLTEGREKIDKGSVINDIY